MLDAGGKTFSFASGKFSVSVYDAATARRNRRATLAPRRTSKP